MSALETFSSSSWIAPSPLPPSIPIFPMTDETRTSANGDGDWLIQPELNGAGNSSWRRQRRQLNIPVNNRPRHAQLYNTKQKYFVQVQHDGRIRTTTQSNSLFCKQLPVLDSANVDLPQNNVYYNSDGDFGWGGHSDAHSKVCQCLHL